MPVICKLLNHELPIEMFSVSTNSLIVAIEPEKFYAEYGKLSEFIDVHMRLKSSFR